MCGKTTVTSKDSCLEQHGTCYKGSSILKNIHTHLRSCSRKDMFQITKYWALIMCMWICFLQWKTAKFPFKPCCWPNTEISKFLLILHSNYSRSNFIIWLIFLPPMYLSFSPALIFFKSWPSMNYYFSTLKCIFPYWFLLFSCLCTTTSSISNRILVNALLYLIAIWSFHLPIICPVKGKTYTTTQHSCSESAVKDCLEDANFEYRNVSQTKKIPMLEKDSSTLVSQQQHWPLTGAQRKNHKNPERMWNNDLVWTWRVRHYSLVVSQGK